MSFIHTLTMGHFDEASAGQGKLVVVCSLDPLALDALLTEFRDPGAPGLCMGDHAMILHDGCVSCVYYSPGVNERAIRFALALKRVTGCQAADVRHRRLFSLQELEDLLVEEE